MFLCVYIEEQNDINMLDIYLVLLEQLIVHIHVIIVLITFCSLITIALLVYVVGQCNSSTFLYSIVLF